MSAPVDVLVALDRLVESVNDDEIELDARADLCRDGAAARAAVAELVKSVDRIAYRLDQCGTTADGITKAQAAAGLRAAIASVGVKA